MEYLPILIILNALTSRPQYSVHIFPCPPPRIFPLSLTRNPHLHASIHLQHTEPHLLLLQLYIYPFLLLASAEMYLDFLETLWFFFWGGGYERTGGVGKVGSWWVVLRRGGMGFLPELCAFVVLCPVFCMCRIHIIGRPPPPPGPNLRN